MLGYNGACKVYIFFHQFEYPTWKLHIELILMQETLSQHNVILIFPLQNSFSDIAKMLSEFFRDLDVVPSDIAVGLVLLSKRQRLLRLRTIHQVRELSFLIGIL